MGSNQERFLEKLKGLFPENFEEVAQNIQSPKPVVFRVNTLQASEKEIMKSLEKKGFVLKRGPVPESHVVVNSPTRLSKTPEFTQGKIYIQSLSSMLPIIALDPKPGEKLLDMCAAPGSKTSQAATATSNKLEIVAVENNRNRFFALKRNLENQNVRNVKVLLENARLLDKNHPELVGSFDKVLLDAPCSNEGNIRLSIPKTLESWNPKSAKSLSKLQKGLISTAIRLTKPGGILVYSTCTFSKEENEDVVSWALKKFPEMELISQKRIIPDKYFLGFFIAKLKKS